MKSFSELSLSAPLKNNLKTNGFIEPTPVQAQAVEPALAGRDLIVTAQTGTGKTLAFVLPILARIGELKEQHPTQTGIRAVILSPTRELAIQIETVFTKMAVGTGIRACSAVGGLSERPQLKAIRSGAQVLIATPGRMFDFVNRRLIDLSGVRMFALDEADRMLDMGFLPTVKRLMAATPNDRQTLFFSATIESSVKHLVDAHVRNAVRIEVGSISKPTEQVALHLYEVDQDRKLGLLTGMIKKDDGLFLVFTRTKHGADKLSKKLSQAGIKSVAIHGDRSQNQRNQALEGFQSGYYRVMVATDVASRGIHVDSISHVVNYDLPQVAEDFIHRVGRTGRAGATGTASTFATRGERGDIANIERRLGIRMLRNQVSPDVEREAKSTAAPVIVIPNAASRHSSARTFEPRGNKTGKRMARRA